MVIHCDGSCYHKDKRMGVGIAFFEEDSNIPFREESITIVGEAQSYNGSGGSSNEAEYYAIINALQIIGKDYESSEYISIYTDSQLIYNQIIGDWRCNNAHLKSLLNEVLRLVGELKKVPLMLFYWCPRENERQQIADKLSKEANPYFNEKVNR